MSYNRWMTWFWLAVLAAAPFIGATSTEIFFGIGALTAHGIGRSIVEAIEARP